MRERRANKQRFSIVVLLLLNTHILLNTLTRESRLLLNTLPTCQTNQHTLNSAHSLLLLPPSSLILHLPSLPSHTAHNNPLPLFLDVHPSSSLSRCTLFLLSTSLNPLFPLSIRRLHPSHHLPRRIRFRFLQFLLGDSIYAKWIGRTRLGSRRVRVFNDEGQEWRESIGRS